MCIAFRGHQEIVGDGKCEGGNFLGLVYLLSKTDPFLRDLINTPAGTVRYLSPKIQNELINILGNETRRSLIRKMVNAPCYSIIVDSTSDITRVDQLSVIVRWMEIPENCESPGREPKVRETFLGFIPTSDATANGLTRTFVEHLVKLGIDLKKFPGQGYDGASTMSDEKGGVQMKFRELVQKLGVKSQVPFVHCATHNLNLVVNDAVQGSVEGVTFFGSLAELFNFFGWSLNRWRDLELSKTDESKFTLKKLCTTRWASRINSVRAVKNRFIDVLKVLTRITLESKDPKERADAVALKAHLNRFEFILMIIIWERILTSINLASKELQKVNLDLSVSVKLLSMALEELKYLRESWNEVLGEAHTIAQRWGIPACFKSRRIRKTKRFFDELVTDSRLADAEMAFKVNNFYKVLDIAISQLRQRFEGQRSVTEVFGFLMPRNLTKASYTNLETSVKRYVNNYPSDITSYAQSDLLVRTRSFVRFFREKLTEKSSIADILKILHNEDLLSSFAELANVCIHFMTLPVSVATAERSFSKLKIIKNYLRSTIAQDRLDSLAMLSIENEEAQSLDTNNLIDMFGKRKSRAEKFTK